MRQMKDSGIEWIGQIPQEWNILTFQQATERMATGLNPRDNFVLTADDEVFYVTIKNFKNGKLFLDENCDKISVEAFNLIQQRSQLQKGDILFASISEEGNAYIIDENPKNWNINESVFVIRPNLNRMTTKYFYYHLTDVGYYSDLRNDATGATFQSIKQNKLRKSRMVMPPLAEQIRITDFLDVKCAEIDDLIAAKEKTNALLRERRQSIIYEAVTKGLDPTVPMKDSGIEWIEVIPEDWDTRKIKYCFEVYAGATPKSGNSEFWDGDIVWVTPADYTTEQKYISAGRKNITQEGFESCSTELIPAGSLIFSKRAPIGLVAINTVDMCTNQGCLSCVPRGENDVEYFYYAFSCFTEQFDLYGSGTTFKEISADAFMNFIIPYPAPEVQRQISDYLRGKCAEMDTLISANEATIQKLKEYRQSVIYEAVTGKVEV